MSPPSWRPKAYEIQAHPTGFGSVRESLGLGRLTQICSQSAWAGS
jgi:hypothetical protein